MSLKYRKLIVKVMIAAVLSTILLVGYFGYQSFCRIQNPTQSQIQGKDSASYISEPIQENGLIYTRQVKVVASNDTVDKLQITLAVDYKGRRALFNSDTDFNNQVSQEYDHLNKAFDDNLPLTGVTKKVDQTGSVITTTITVSKDADQSGLYFMLLHLPDKQHNMTWITTIKATNNGIHLTDFDKALHTDGLHRE